MKRFGLRLLPITAYLAVAIIYIALVEPTFLKVNYFWWDVLLNLSLILIVFFGFLWLVKKLLKEEWLSVFFTYSVAVLTAGALNKIMHWPGAKMLLYGSQAFLLLSVVMAVVGIFWKKK